MLFENMVRYVKKFRTTGVQDRSAQNTNCGLCADSSGILQFF